MTKLVRFLDPDMRIMWGQAQDDELTILEGDPFSGYELTQKHAKASSIIVLAPVIPSKIIAVGLNYRKHTAELGMKMPDEPVLFIKPASAVIGNLGSIVYPANATRVDYEAELAVIMRARCRNISESDADNFILGYTCLNDVTERDMQKKDGQWTRAKSFDTFAPIGPYIVTGIDPDSQSVRCYLNGELRQDSNTSELIFKTRRLVSFVSHIMTLEPGDIISTGTPEGVGPMKRGDKVEVEIGEIGRLINFVV